MSTGVMARQSTSVILDVGPILDSTGEEYASAVIADLTISKNGSRAAMSGNTFTHAGNGHYSLTLTTTDTNTLGVIQISCNKSTYQMPVKERQVVPANIYDAIVLGSDFLQADAVQFAGQTITAAAGVTMPSDPADQSLIIAATDALATLIGDVPTNAELATALGTADDATLAAIAAEAVKTAAIKAKTDSLTFTTANKVDSTAVLDSASRLAIWNTLTTETFTADSFGELLLISDGTNGRAVKVTGANHIAADVHDCQADGLSGSTEIANIQDAAGWLLAIGSGAVANPQTSTEQYDITQFGVNYRVAMAGLTSTGTRTAPTLSKP